MSLHYEYECSVCKCPMEWTLREVLLFEYNKCISCDTKFKWKDVLLNGKPLFEDADIDIVVAHEQRYEHQRNMKDEGLIESICKIIYRNEFVYLLAEHP